MKNSFKRIVSFVLCVFLAFGMFAVSACFNEPVPDKVTIIFDKNLPVASANVTDFPDPETISIDSGSKVIRPSVDPKISGYTFGGWYINEACTNEFDFDVPVTSVRTFIFAKWTRNVTYYDVVFDLNYTGAPTPETVPIVSGNTVQQPDAPERDGYSFDGWSTSQTGADGSYNFSAPVTASIRLHAIWTKQWTVIFDFNYENAPNPQTFVVREGDSVEMFVPDSRDGWNYGGWYTDLTYTTEYAFGAVTANTTVYAMWTEIETFTTTFNLNYAGAPTPPAPQTVTGGTISRPTPDPARDGYAFDGWYMQETGGAEYNFNAAVTRSRTLYARWTKLWVVTFDFNFTGSTAQTQTVREGATANTGIITPPAHPTGWTFGGWYNEITCLTEYESGAVTANKTVYAKWVDPASLVDAYTVTFNLNYPDAPMPPVPQTVTGGTITRPTPDPAREGYAFDGWYTQAIGGTLYNFGTTVTQDRTLYARWTKLWVVTFDFNFTGSTSQTQNVREGATANQGIVELPAHPTGATFGGWYNEAACLTEYEFGVVTANKTVYAKWIQETRVVTFNLNYTGASSPATQTVNVGASATRPTPPSRDGFTFAGWYTQASGNTLYAFSSVTTDITVYARWYVKLSLDLNYSGAPTISDRNIFEGATLAAPETPSRAPNAETGNPYTFMGWATSVNSSSYFDGFGVPATDNLTLYAQWKHEYVFEAELSYLDDLLGQSVSGVAPGTAMIIEEHDYGNPEVYPPTAYSNGYAVAYLYGNGLALTFDIHSDRAAEVTLKVRFTCEFAPQTFIDEMYTVELNGKIAGYIHAEIDFDTGYIHPCQEVSFTVSLNAGDNRVRLITTNDVDLIGTMNANAPIIDCIKIDTVAKLNMFTIDTIGEFAGRRLEGPRYSNMDRFK